MVRLHCHRQTKIFNIIINIFKFYPYLNSEIIERGVQHCKNNLRKSYAVRGEPIGVETFEDLLEVVDALEKKLTKIRNKYDHEFLRLMLDRVRDSFDTTIPPPSYESLFDEED